MHHFIEARKGIESVGIRLALQKATAKDIAHLRDLNQKMLDDLKMGVRQNLRSDNLAFFLAIVQISGNPIITLMIHSLVKLVDTRSHHSGNGSKRHPALRGTDKS